MHFVSNTTVEGPVLLSVTSIAKQQLVEDGVSRYTIQGAVLVGNYLLNRVVVFKDARRYTYRMPLRIHVMNNGTR